MIEYLYDAVRATAGEDIIINAKITENNEELVTENCYLSFSDDEHELFKVIGDFDGEVWSFAIPEEVTKDFSGRYWYSIKNEKSSLSFKQPIYLV